MSGTFMDKSFSVAVGGDQQYRDNWERTFGKHPEECDCCSCDEPQLHALRECSECKTEKAPEKPLEPECNCHFINVGDEEHHQFWCARVSQPPLAR